MTITAIVQARMTSRRFPGKVVAPLLGTPVLEHVLIRAKAVPGVQKVVCAFPDDPVSEPILGICRNMRVIAFAGSEDDVLARYYEAAKQVAAKTILRITADCPLLDPAVCGALLEVFLLEGLDYASNVHPERTYPRGLDCEAFSFTCLEAAHLSAEDPYDREHVTPWMQRTHGLNRACLKSKKDFSKLNYCIDYPHDIARVEKIIQESMS